MRGRISPMNSSLRDGRRSLDAGDMEVPERVFSVNLKGVSNNVNGMFGDDTDLSAHAVSWSRWCAWIDQQMEGRSVLRASRSVERFTPAADSDLTRLRARLDLFGQACNHLLDVRDFLQPQHELGKSDFVREAFARN